MIPKLLTSLVWSQRRLVVWTVVLSVAAVIVLYLKRNDIVEYKHAYDDCSKLRDEVDGLKTEITRLERERQDLSKDGFAAEKVARERFRLSKPGEMVLYLDTPGKNGALQKQPYIPPTPTPRATPRPKETSSKTDSKHP